jgi:hypothetical protein
MNKLLEFNQEWIKENNIIVNDYGHDIWLLENFLTEEMSDDLLEYIKIWPEEDWRKMYWDNIMKRYNEFWRNGNDFLYTHEDILHSIATKQIKDIDTFFRNYEFYFDKSIDISEYKNKELYFERWKSLFKPTNPEDKDRFDIDLPSSVERRYIGDSGIQHRDHAVDGSLIYATILYINGDFTGGNLHFPELKTTIYPKKGSLCVFDASNNWTHQVTTVTEGTRYSIPIFVWDKTKDDTYRKMNK